MITLAERPRWAVDEAARAADQEAEFLRRHGVREFRNRYRNVRKVLMSSGRPDRDVRPVLMRLTLGGDGLTSFGPFDHPGVFGRDREPLILVGHPYGLATDEARADLDAVRSLGLVVEVNPPGASFYGYGTHQVLVFSRHYTPPEPATA